MSLLIDMVKNIKGKPTDKVSVDTHKARVSKCYSCPSLLITGNCSICGCFVKDKAKYVGESCPDGKW
jgi:hypothetical protein